MEYLSGQRARTNRHRSRIPYQDLPLTFQDAVQIAQMLGIEYLWIDSLCIRQDDPAEWEREATRMDQVYMGATLTVAASDGTSASSGFFANRCASTHNADVVRAHLTITSDDGSGQNLLVQVQDRGLDGP
jgi:hypothetical protein